MTDEDLRLRFVFEPINALADLHRRGFELTEDEIDLFLHSDAHMWFWIDEILGERQH